MSLFQRSSERWYSRLECCFLACAEIFLSWPRIEKWLGELTYRQLEVSCLREDS